MKIFAPWKYQEIYLYRTKRPSGWGRHNGYTGRSCAPKIRDKQHRNGGRGKPAASWSDLDPQRYVLIRFKHFPEWGIIPIEWLCIKLTMPVYNDQHNRWNPRRISKRKAKAQRARRDAGWPPVGSRIKDVATLVPVLGVVLIAMGLWMGVIR